MKLSTCRYIALLFIATSLSACDPSNVDLNSESVAGSSSSEHLEENYTGGSFNDAGMSSIDGELPGTGTLQDPYTITYGERYSYTWKAKVDQASFIKVWGYSPEDPDSKSDLQATLSCSPTIDSTDCGLPSEIECELRWDRGLREFCYHNNTFLMSTSYGLIQLVKPGWTSDYENINATFGIQYSLCGADESKGCDVINAGYAQILSLPDPISD